MQTNNSISPRGIVQSGRPSSKIAISDEAQQEVRQAFLASMRQRFKTEINRLTGGDMLDLLRNKSSAQDDAGNLGFLMTYVYAWNWLQQNCHVDYQQAVLDAFMKGPQAFLMQMLLQSHSTAEFIQSYIHYWQSYQGQPQLQQQQLLSLLQKKAAWMRSRHMLNPCGIRSVCSRSHFPMVTRIWPDRKRTVMPICWDLKT